MTIQLHNVLTGKKEEFHPIEEGVLKIYVCGVTVYGRCHVGHLRCYLSFDAVLRYFAYRGYSVRYVRNFTDIDDKIIARAKEIEAGPDGDWRQEASYRDYTADQWKVRLEEDEQIAKRAQGQQRHLAEVVADHFIDSFRNQDFGPFELFPAASEPRVSEHIPDVIALVERIIDNGFAYESAGDVYFDVEAYHNRTREYGKLSRRDMAQMMEGARVSPSDRKRNGADFALWKRASEGEPAWPSPWGPGRPGWHIECSAMSEKELGTPFDIHGGGKDLIFPHHENEIAQSEAANGRPFCNTWVHNGFVTVDGVKMSKSLGNFITIQEGLEMAPPEVWRYLVLSTHYANPIDFSRTRNAENGADGELVRGSIDIAFDRVEYFYETLGRADEAMRNAEIPEDGPLLEDSRSTGVVSGFVAAMDDDINTARALAGIGEVMKYVNELCDMKAKQIRGLRGGRDAWLGSLRRMTADLREVLNVLGLCAKEPAAALEELRRFSVHRRGLNEELIVARLADRTRAREEKDWARSDAIRDELLEMGVELRDGPEGTDWKVIRA